MNDKRVECTFLWFIENYSYCWHKKGERLVSPHFTADGLEGTAWRLGLYPRGHKAAHNGCISLFLIRSGAVDGPESVSLKYELSFLAENGHTLYADEKEFTFKRGKGHGWPYFLQLDDVSLKEKSDCFPRDILTVRCKMWKSEGSFHEVAPICARTRIAIESFSFLHVVENFSTLEPGKKNTVEILSHSKKGRAVSSSLYFTDDSCSEGKMVIEIVPNNNNYILCVRKISLLDASGNIIGCGENDNRFDAKRKDIQKLPLSLTRQAVLTKKSEYLPVDKLSLLCECTFSTGLEFEKIEGTRHQIPSVPLSLIKTAGKAAVKQPACPSVSEDMQALYSSECLTDVRLKTETNSFPAHKIVLCARSPVFKAIMTNDKEDKYNNWILEVGDMKDEIVQQLLLFLYSDTIENLQWNSASQLYSAAYKYQIGKLKDFCSSFLVENLTASNATELLPLAHKHKDTDLKKSVEDFILEHEQQVFVSKEWEMLMETNPLLVMKTMHLKYKRKNKLN